MPSADLGILDLPHGARPDPDEFVRAAMRWHFDPRTGSPFWLGLAPGLGFDPLSDVKTLADLSLFPDVAGRMRDVRIRDLIPQGYGPRPPIAGVFESGGTTGGPKRVLVLEDWLERLLAWSDANLDAHGFGRGTDWLGLVPTGPHFVGEFFRRSAARRGGLAFAVDLDPRWVKKLIASGRPADAGGYAEHLIAQAADVLRTQQIGVLTITPPLLERLAADEELAGLIDERVGAMRWGGTQMDPDSRALYRAEVFPNVALCGNYGSTMMLGVAGERPGLGEADPCVFEPLAPWVTFSVVDPDTRLPVGYGERGRVVVSHVSRSFLLPNSLERDLATRIRPDGDFPGGDWVADIAPVSHFEDELVIEGVY